MHVPAPDSDAAVGRGLASATTSLPPLLVEDGVPIQISALGQEEHRDGAAQVRILGGRT